VRGTSGGDASGRDLVAARGEAGGRLGSGAVSELPSGAVTFLFTDIEGSTRLVKALRERYPQVLAEHRRLVRAAIAGQAGHEVGTEGDAFFAAFAGAKQAVLCALEIQRALAAHEWPADAAVRVRIGIHTGQAVPTGEDYTGLAVHRAARICAVARGGQVLISQATQTIIEDEEDDPGFTLVDLGERALKDLDRPVRLFELAAPGLAAGGLPAAAQSASQAAPAPAGRHNLPAPLTSFLGREEDLARVEQLLGQARLVTLTGPGGTGKTRLAMEAGTRVVGRFPDGVWLVELAGVADPGLVAGQLMGALGVRQAGDVPVLEALIYRLASAELLLIVDNCEHLLDACADLCGMLLGAAPRLRVLATSREALGIAGEVTYPVRPLELPPEQPDAQQAGQSAAVRLFLERGAAARGATGRTAGGVAPVAAAERICRALDGLPLAIELAAARLGTLSAAEIEAHLADRFRFLAYRRPAANPRHQALRAAMDWSYDLLDAEERRVLAELSVFAGTFGIAQAAEVCTGGDQDAALEVIDGLAAKSLVAAEPAEDGTRYRLLDTVRYYAADRLAEAGGTDAARDRHAAAFAGLAERERELAVLAREQDNFRAALEWSLARGDPAGLRLARALGEFWISRGLLAEGQDWLERALAQHPADQRLRADLLRLLGAVLFEAGEPHGAHAVLSDAFQVAAGAPAMQARIRALLADVRFRQGAGIAEMLAECEAAAAVLEAEGDLYGLADALTYAGRLRGILDWAPGYMEVLERAIACARQSGNHRAQMRASGWLAVSYRMAMPIPVDAAVARIEEFLHDASGDTWAEAQLLGPLSALYGFLGRSADARTARDCSQSIITGFGAELILAETTVGAGLDALTLGDPVAAERYARAGYETFQAMGERYYLALATVILAEALYDQGRFDEAAQMIEGPLNGASPTFAARAALVKAKLLARRGQFAAARQLADEGARLAPAASLQAQATVHEARAEVERLAGEPGQAATRLRAALEIYEDRRATALADRVRTALASLTAAPDPDPT
jgi:predicted ATPase/class 3 adenylate cyclase